MNNAKFYLGIDIGSTAVKAALVASDTLRLTACRGCAYPTKREGTFVTQSPHDWVSAAVSAVRDVLSTTGDTPCIAGISVSAQGGSIFAADRDREPISDAVSWMDARASKEADELYREFGEDIYRACGWRLSPLDDASKLLWLRKNDPELFERAAYFMTTADFFTGWLCGNSVYDPTSAAITRLFDIRTGKYNDALISRIGIEKSKFSAVLPCGKSAGTLGANAASALGLLPGIPVWIGAHDQYCAALGSGITRPGQLLIATGTAWVLFGVTGQAEFSELHAAPGVFPNICGSRNEPKYGVIAAMSGIGASVERYAVLNGRSLSDSDAEAARLLQSNLTSDRAYTPFSPCEDGRGFLPHAAGTGIVFDKLADAEYTQKYLGLLEGAAFETLAAAEKIHAGKDLSLVMSGGAARSSLWRNIVASAAASQGWRLAVSTERDAPAYGAALISAAADGADISDVAKNEATVPDAAYTEYLGRAFRVWKENILIG